MIKINEHYEKLNTSYLFADIANRIAAFQKENKNVEIIKMGIGDVVKPLPASCIQALHTSIDEMANEKNFKGYGPETGYPFLREIVAKNDFSDKGCPISADEIFISDGSKCDTANIQEIFSDEITIAVPDPVYPVYVDSNVMAGRTGEYADGVYKGLVYLASTPANGFVPELPDQKVDLIYLCFPNNPTGATASKKELERWVEYARKNKSIILFDAAYTAFIKDENIPRSIYEIDGADEVAIEFRSYSKTAGFTGLRCAYTVVPKKCCAYKKDGTAIDLHSIWYRRQSTKFNGVSYPVQKAAEAVYSPEGKKEIQQLIDYYLTNARIIRDSMESLGYTCTGGENSPYVWVQTGGSSWDFFDRLLHTAGVVITPGAGFGKAGEGFIRISAFNSLTNVKEAVDRIKAAVQRIKE